MGVRATVAALLLLGCGASPNGPQEVNLLAGLTIRASGSSLILDRSGEPQRVPVTHTWAFDDSLYAFRIDYPEPRHVWTPLPSGDPFFHAWGRYWLECDPGHVRICAIVVERVGGHAWDWQAAGLDSVEGDIWAADIILGETTVRIGPFAYEVIRD